MGKDEGEGSEGSPGGTSEEALLSYPWLFVVLKVC